MTISEKSAYLKGLMDGLKLDTESNEGKMIAAIVDLLGDMSKRMVDIEDTTIAISDELDEIEEDLDAIEDFIMDEDDEDDWDEYEDLVLDEASGRDECQWVSLSEKLADVYQPLRNFVWVYQQRLEQCMQDALWAVRDSFELYWGQNLVDTLRRLHRLKYALDKERNEDDI